MTDLSRHELLVLKEIRLTGQTAQKTFVRQLLYEEIIVDVEGRLDLTSKGRSLLVRGSPSLWGSALPPKADMCSATADVRYGPRGDIPSPAQFRPFCDP
jgi:hypothetical protein